MEQLRPSFLRCEYVENPMGVQSPNPDFSWRCESTRPGGRQTAYQIVMAHTPQELADGDYTVWNTGKVTEDQFSGISYQGIPLHSSERVYWKLRIWDENDVPGEYSEVAFFEMGLLCSGDWKGRWMGFLGGMVGNGILMRYTFTLDRKPHWARAYIAGLGYYELRLNGKKVGDKLLDPGATDYSRTILYSAYDVTDYLVEGLNVTGIILGTGWAGFPRALLQLNVEFTDGSKKEIYTDWGTGWMVARGPITCNSIYDGEDYDARLERDGWDSPEHDAREQAQYQRPDGWILGTVVEGPGGELTGEISPPVRVTGVFEPKLVKTYTDGRELYDAGANRTGWIRLRLDGERGASVRLVFAEVLNEEGELELRPLRTARVTDTYILRGDKGVEEYAPRFTYHGFRYFTVQKQGKVHIETMSMEFVRSDMRRNAVFYCEDEFLNRLADTFWHTDACNMFSIPTDCAQRDERLGWTTDTANRIDGCIYHFDMASFFNKWLRDIYDTQDNGTGYFADTAPHRWGRRPCDPMASTPAALPLLLYHAYGNRQVLDRCYEPLKRYVDALLVEADRLIVSRTGFGEWACPKEECYPEQNGPGAISKNIDPAAISTIYFRHCVVLLAKTAGILGKEREAAYYQDMAEFIRKRFNEAFFNSGTCRYDRGSQSVNALAVHHGLVEDEYRKKVVENIVKDIREKGGHLSTGNMGTKAVIETLCQEGYDDLAWEIMTIRTSPGFGYMLEQGATSMWERWEADRDNNIMNARNHPMFSPCCVWFYKYLGGIGMEEDTDAFRHLIIAPHVPGGLSRVEVSMEIPAGKVSSAWKKTPSRFIFNLEIPFNTSARVIIPPVLPGAENLTMNGQAFQYERNEKGGFVTRVAAGRHEFVLS
jgi:alpha-L-rhamnosidase